MAAATIGIFASLGTTEGRATLDKAMQIFPNKDFSAVAKLAAELNMPFILAAGRLDIFDDGIVQALAQDEAAALVCLSTINRRMGEAGASSTRWIIAGDPGFQQRAMLAAQSTDKGTT